MEYLQESELWRRIDDTLHGSGRESLFVAFDGASQVQAILRESSACASLKISEFCREDSTINLDAFRDALGARGPRTLVLGVGEYAALVGDWRPLHLLWEARRSGGKFVAPIFDGYGELERMQAGVAFRPMADPVVYLERTRNLWSYKKYSVPAGVECTGMKAILQKLETGHTGVLTVKTAIPLKEDRGVSIDTYGDFYLAEHPGENLSRSMLAEEQWQTLVEQPEQLDDSFFGIANYMRLNREPPANPYLRKVLAKTKKQADFRRNFIEHILDYAPGDVEFPEMAKGRHELVAEVDEDDIRAYLLRLAKIPPTDRIAYLSPQREEERLEILKCVSAMPELVSRCGLENLAAYLEDFELETADQEKSAILVNHFQAYKRAKLANCADGLPVPCNGLSLINSLPTRNALVEKLKEPQAKLYWVDALGCEFLAFFQHHARKNGLKMHAIFGRVKLPSITSLNRDFYEAWPFAKTVVRELDAIKHGHLSQPSSEDCKRWPLHLLEELKILEQLIIAIGRELKNGKYEKIVVASDHGATRMAVIANDELRWEMPEKGRFGGRCCPAGDFNEALPPNIVRGDEGEWLVVTDYARFRGSHQALVEAHGGATLEEAVVPVLEFSLGKPLPEIIQITERNIRVSPGQAAVLVEIASNRPLERPVLRLRGRVYPLAQAGELRYKAEIPVADLEETNAGEIYVGNDKLARKVVFELVRGVKKNESFDDFFD